MKKYIFYIYILLICFTGFFAHSQEKIDIADDLRIKYRDFTALEIEELRARVGVYEPNRDYNVIIDGHGTGFAPPTEGGYIELLENGKVITEFIPLGAGFKSPVSYDNSTLAWFPPIGDQGGEGSCTCWGFAYYTKTFQEALERAWDLSGAWWDVGNNEPTPAIYQTQIFSPDFLYHLINSGQSGSWPDDALKVLTRIGCATWTYMPYSDTDHTSWPSESAWRDAPQYRCSESSYQINFGSALSVAIMKNVLSTNKTIIIVVEAGQYANFDENDLLTVNSYDPIEPPNHVNTIVGYDDNYGPYMEDGNPSTYGAFKVVNSWGEGGWENVADGSYWLSYNAILKLAFNYGYVVLDRIGYQPKYLAVLNITHNSRGDCIKGVSRENPHLSKNFDNIYGRGGNQAFPANDIVLDITDLMSVSPRATYRLELYDLDAGQAYPPPWGDAGTANIGTINKFWIEDYLSAGSDYANQLPANVYTSSDTPVTTINWDVVYAYVHTNYIPELNWTGEPGYVSDGVKPGMATGSTTFSFRILYSDGENKPPEVKEVWIDMDDSETYEDAEKFTMTKADSSDDTYTDSVKYIFEKYLSYAGDGKLNYRFYFTDKYDTACGEGSEEKQFVISENKLSLPTDKVLVFPNPYRPEYGTDSITFYNIPANTKIQIFNIMGERVFEAIHETEDLNFEWYIINNKGKNISSGVYIYIVRESDGTITKGKLAIIK